MDDANVVVFSKHFEPKDFEAASALRGRALVVYDICDLHFLSDNPVGEHYRRMCKVADVVTCSTKLLSAAIMDRMNRGAIVIPDATETTLQPPKAPTDKRRVLWYGHASNWAPMSVLLPLDGYKLEVVSRGIERTGDYAVTEWSQDAQRHALARADVVVVPQTDNPKNRAKSHNRVTEAVRAGRYVVTDENVLEYAIYNRCIWRGNIKTGLEWAFSHPDECADQIKHAQVVSQRFLPELVANMWLEVFGRAL